MKKIKQWFTAWIDKIRAMRLKFHLPESRTKYFEHLEEQRRVWDNLIERIEGEIFGLENSYGNLLSWLRLRESDLSWLRSAQAELARRELQEGTDRLQEMKKQLDILKKAARTGHSDNKLVIDLARNDAERRVLAYGPERCAYLGVIEWEACQIIRGGVLLCYRQPGSIYVYEGRCFKLIKKRYSPTMGRMVIITDLRQFSNDELKAVSNHEAQIKRGEKADVGEAVA